MEFPTISFLTDGTISSATGNSSSALPRVVPQFLSFNVLGQISIQLPLEHQISLPNVCKEMSMVISKSGTDQVDDEEFTLVSTGKKYFKE